jgi:LDH2 family malate/lactate/ureidoglycolate dehydrogenase
MATTNVILTRVRMAAEEKRPLPEGAAVDKDGKPTTDPLSALEGSLTTFGGFKGSGLSIMISILAGPLLGVPSSSSSTTDRGMLIVLFKPGLLRDPADLDREVEESLSTFRDRGSSDFHLPGERSDALMQSAYLEGIDFPQAYLDLLAPSPDEAEDVRGT